MKALPPPPALNALKHAIQLVQQLAPSCRHSITLVSVQDGGDTASECEKALKPATRLLERSHIPHTVDIRTAPSAAPEILTCAKAGRFHLIVLGTKGRSAIADLLLGSVAHRVLATAEMPLLLVK